jgi:hypothetical protein
MMTQQHVSLLVSTLSIDVNIVITAAGSTKQANVSDFIEGFNDGARDQESPQ